MSKVDIAAGGIEQMLASLCDELTCMYVQGRGDEACPGPRTGLCAARTFNKDLDLCDGTRMRLEGAICHHLPISLSFGSLRLVPREY